MPRSIPIHRTQTRKPKLTVFFVMVYVAILCLLGGIAAVGTTRDISLSDLVQDPAATLNAPFYVGIISNIGILLWTATMTICFLYAYLCTFMFQNKDFIKFFLWSGFVIGILLLDDFFMLHESVPFSENFIFLLYMAVICGYIYIFRHTLKTTNYMVFFAALGLFLVSILFDKVPGASARLGLSIALSLDVVYFFEESSKLLGIGTWFVYYLQTGAHLTHVKMFDTPPRNSCS